MKESDDGQGSVASRLWALMKEVIGIRKDTDHLQGYVKELNNNIQNQRRESGEAFQRIDDRFEKLNDKFDSRFLWMLGVVAIPLNLALLGFLAHVLGWI